MNNNFKIVALLAFSIFPLWAFAAPVPALIIPDLVSSADEVVSGKVLSIDKGEVIILADQVFHSRLITQGSKALLKGYFGNLAVDEYRIFFLKRNDYGLTPLSEVYPSILIGNPLFSSHSTLEWIAEGLLQKIEESSSADMVVKLSTYGGSFHSDYNNNNIMSAIAFFPKQVIESVCLRHFRSTSNNVVKVWATVGLLGVGNIDTLKETLPLVALPRSTASDYTRDRFADSIDSLQVSSPDKSDLLVSIIGSLCSSNNLRMRRSAFAALRLNPSRAAFYLFKSGLDDRDQKVRYFSISGLSELIKVRSVPSVDSYEQNEGEIESFWRIWLKAHPSL